MPKEYNLPCSMAKALEIVGDRWTLLIVRDLLALGPRKYVELQSALAGIAPNVLSDRLKLLEEHGVVEREFYEEHPPRARYRLTRKGVGLRFVVYALLEWGNKYEYDAVSLQHDVCGHELRLKHVCDHCATEVGPRSVRRKFKKREAALAAGETF